MPPVRRKKTTARQRADNVNEPSLNDLRQQCRDKGLSDQGRKNTLIARLQQHASTSSSGSCSENTPTRTNETNSHNEQITTETISTPSESPRESPLLNDAQLAQIQSIIAQTVQQSVNDIVTNAARAAVQAMASTPVATSTSDAQQSEPLLDNATAIIQTEPKTPHGSLRIRLAATTRVPYGQSFHDVPASYVRKIQSGEFFELSKLLPKNLLTTADEQPVMLTLENSIIKVKPSNQSTTTLTDIEQCTTAFTTYMSVFTHMSVFTPGTERGICRDFNRTEACSRRQCKYRHVCNRCYGEHAGNICPGDERARRKEKLHSTRSHRQPKQAKH